MSSVELFELLIILPYWDGDKARLRPLCRLIAGFSSGFNEKVRFLMAPRFDSSFDEQSISVLSKAFRVEQFRCTGSATGYPMGANGQFVSAFLHVSAKYAKMCQAVLWLEMDMVPCQKEWLARLWAAWTGRRSGVYAIGHIFSPNGDERLNHLNGGAVYSPQLVKVIPRLMSFNYSTAWDWMLRNEFLKISQDTPEIRYMHQGKGIQQIPVPTPSIIHNVKDDSLIRLVASKHGISLDD